MIIVNNSQVDLTIWESLLHESRYSSPFQTPSFYNLCNSIEGYSACVFAIQKETGYSGLVVVTLQREKGVKGYFSKRAVIYGGPVINGTTKDELSLLLKTIVRHLKAEVIYIETRNYFDFSSYADSFFKAKWKYEPYLNVKLNLNGLKKKDISTLFKYNRRREIKQSIENGATYKQCNSEEELFSIYQILSDLYRDRVKLPLPSFDFFLFFYRSKILKAFVVMHGGNIIGGAYCPVLAEKGLYTFYYCGKRDYHKRIFPTHLAILAAIEYAVENNIPMIDFMGAGKPGVDYGVKKYKLEFGGELVEHGRFFIVLNPFLYSLGKFGLQIIKKIK